MNAVFSILLNILLGAIIGMGWSILFKCSKKALLYIGVLSGFGYALRFICLDFFGFQLIISTLVSCVFVGLISVFLSRKLDTPTVVFSMPVCITMIPGLYAYNTMISLIKISNNGLETKDQDNVDNAIHYAVITIALLLILSIGIMVGSLLFRKKTIVDISMDVPSFKKK